MNNKVPHIKLRNDLKKHIKTLFNKSEPSHNESQKLELTKLLNSVIAVSTNKDDPNRLKTGLNKIREALEYMVYSIYQPKSEKRDTLALAKIINTLFDNGIIPKSIQEDSHYIRTQGNLGSHNQQGPVEQPKDEKFKNIFGLLVNVVDWYLHDYQPKQTQELINDEICDRSKLDEYHKKIKELTMDRLRQLGLGEESCFITRSLYWERDKDIQKAAISIENLAFSSESCVLLGGSGEGKSALIFQLLRSMTSNDRIKTVQSGNLQLFPILVQAREVIQEASLACTEKNSGQRKLDRRLSNWIVGRLLNLLDPSSQRPNPAKFLSCVGRCPSNL